MFRGFTFEKNLFDSGDVEYCMAVNPFGSLGKPGFRTTYAIAPDLQALPRALFDFRFSMYLPVCSFRGFTYRYLFGHLGTES